MKIVVTTPTGHIGSKLANILLQRGTELTLIQRTPEKVKDLASRGAKVIAGGHGDPKVLGKAVEGADALFWLSPPFPTSHDPLADTRHIADEAATVIRKHPDLRVVQLSSVGANRPDGTGPIVGVHDTEERFRAVGKNITSLRANYFMENVLNSLPTIARDGALYTTAPGSASVPMVATQDIAEAAADVLLAPRNGHHIVDIVGPEEVSLDRAAEIVAATIGKSVRAVTVPGEALKQGMVHGGLSLEMAELLVEMEESMGDFAHEFLGEKKITGNIAFEQFAREVIAPAYRNFASVARAS